jgi:hypothetical protein
MSKLRNGLGKVRPFFYTRELTKLNTPDYAGGDPATGLACSQAEARV